MEFMTSDVSIIIPTHERPSYLDRILEYYAHEPFHIYVADSSALPYNGSRLKGNVTYFHLPGKFLTYKIAFTLEYIETPFVVMCADDDFIIPAAIQTCVEFLSDHSSYAVAMGNALAYLKTV